MLVKIPIEISARHVHLSQKNLDILFGKGYILTKKNVLSQPGEFAANETVDICFQNKTISNVRIVSPLRLETQVEISLTDAYNLELPAEIRVSGDLKNTQGILLVGPEGKVELKNGVIVAQRHIHVSFREALKLGINGKKSVSVKIGGQRMTTFHNIIVRKTENYRLVLHLDTDEGNAAGIKGKTFGELII